MKEANLLLSTMGSTQPKGGAGSGDVSREDVVYEKATDLLSRLPDGYIEDDYKAKLNKHGGMSQPLNVCLYQELQRFQKVLVKVQTVLSQMQMAISGEVVMTEELQTSLDAIFDAQVPPSWLRTVSGDEFSWLLPTLGLWFSSLLQRDAQYRAWLTGGRPQVFWLTGFLNPQGFLTAMKQEVTRKHAAEKWSLDDMVYHTQVTHFENKKSIHSSPSEGVYVEGLFMDGAAWEKGGKDEGGQITESEPKKLFSGLPILHVSANTKSNEAKVKKEGFGPLGPYECPCYKYASRTDRYFVFIVDLKPGNVAPSHWGLRGLALLCSTE